MLKVALVGRTNVGKSTLFNQLTRRRDALVADEAGLTRDRHYGCVESRGQRWLLIDTGGLTESESGVAAAVTEQVVAQTEWAIAEADLVCFIADARKGLTGADESVVQQLRRGGKPTWLVINKIDGCNEHVVAEFASLGLASCFQTAALQGRGISILRNALAAQAAQSSDDLDASLAELGDGVRVTFFGRPNVGKSTLLNRLLGEERVLTSAVPGTTRDSIAVPFVFGGKNFVLIDTAGVRRRNKVSGRVEKFSVLKTFESMMFADVVVLVCDASDGATTQDAGLADRVISAGRPLVVAINKQDLLVDDEIKMKLNRSLDLGLRFLHGIEVINVSALHNRGTKRLMSAVRKARASAYIQVPTPQCTKLLMSAVEKNQPPTVSGKRIKLRYAHQGGTCPPRFIVYGSRLDALPASYCRYLENYFCDRLKLVGTPVVFEFRHTPNRFVA